MDAIDAPGGGGGGGRRERRRLLPLPRLRLPGLPGFGGGAAAQGGGSPQRRRSRGAKTHFSSASITIADCRVVSGAGAAAAAAAAGAAGAAAALATVALGTVALGAGRGGGGGNGGAGAAAAAPARAGAPLAAAAASARAPAAAAAAARPAPAKAGSKPAARPASDVLAGALARAASQSIIHPLDTLKVRLQANFGGASKAPAAAKAPPPVSKFGKLVPPPGGRLQAAGAGLASLYKGVFGAASGAGIAIGAYFAFYSAACNALAAHTPLAPGAVAFAGGAAAAAGSSVVKVPLAVCIRSVQAGVYPNVFAAARAITAAAGPRGLFTGYWPTLLEDVPDMACKFAAYESMRSLHRRLAGGRDASPGEDFAMGALAGAAAAAATTPLDVVKTRMMCAAASRPTMASAAAATLASGGPGAFFTGVGARALSNGINSAVFFCAFEAIRGAIRRGAAAQAPPPPRAPAPAADVAEAPEGAEGARRRRGAALRVEPLAVDDGKR